MSWSGGGHFLQKPFQPRKQLESEKCCHIYQHSGEDRCLHLSGHDRLCEQEIKMESAGAVDLCQMGNLQVPLGEN